MVVWQEQFFPVQNGWIIRQVVAKILDPSRRRINNIRICEARKPMLKEVLVVEQGDLLSLFVYFDNIKVRVNTKAGMRCSKLHPFTKGRIETRKRRGMEIP